MAEQEEKQKKLPVEQAAAATAGTAGMPSSTMKVVVGPVTAHTKIEGLSFDFNSGARVQVPAGNWRVRMADIKRGLVLLDVKASDAIVSCPKKYHIDYHIEVYHDDKLVFTHDYNDRGQKVLFKNVSNAMGDTIAWIPYAVEYKKQHGCEVYYAMSPVMAKLLAPSYPEIHFIGPDERMADVYASYYIGCFFPPSDRGMQPMDWRPLGMQKAAAYILGLEPVERLAHIAPTDKKRQIKEPYVCIAAQASSQAKYWNNPAGWIDTVRFLKELGYRVLCIDKDRCYGMGWRPNTIPYGAEDFTGDRPLEERVNLLYHADFFIGLASGLSWLAWAVGKPVILISGFSSPFTEFYTPYRVTNYYSCQGCWEDTSVVFEHDDFEWCPHHKGDSKRQFECTRSIRAGYVMQVIRQLMQDHGLEPKSRKNDKKKK